MNLDSTLSNALAAIEREDDANATTLLQSIINDVDISSCNDQDASIAILARSFLGMVYGRADLEDEALAVAREAISLCQSRGIEDLPQPYNNLASILVMLGFELDEPIDLWRHVLEIERRLHGPHAPEVASVLQDLGVAHRFMEQIEPAIKATSEALEIYERHDPLWAYPCMLQRLHLIQCHDRLYQFDESAKVLETILGLFNQAPSDDEVWLMLTVPTIASALQDQGRHEEADWVYEYLLTQLQGLDGLDEALIQTVEAAKAENLQLHAQSADLEDEWAREERESIERYGQDE